MSCQVDVVSHFYSSPGNSASMGRVFQISLSVEIVGHVLGKTENILEQYISQTMSQLLSSNEKIISYILFLSYYQKGQQSLFY